MSILSKNIEPQIDSIGSTCNIHGSYEPCVEHLFHTAQDALSYCIHFDSGNIVYIVRQHFPEYNVTASGSLYKEGWVKIRVHDYSREISEVCQIIVQKRRS